jgi:glutamyl-tRNA reductase
VANRTWGRSVDLARSCGGRAVRLGELSEALTGTDLLLTSTGASTLMLEHTDLEPAGGRRARPLLIVDIAVPRDVDPAAGDLPGVTLLDMDDLRRFAEIGVEERRREVASVQQVLDEELERFVGVASAREVAPLVSALRREADQVREGELERFGARLAGLDGSEREAVEALTKGIVAKLLHEPTVELKDAAGSPRGERLAEALRDLFRL